MCVCFPLVSSSHLCNNPLLLPIPFGARSKSLFLYESDSCIRPKKKLIFFHCVAFFDTSFHHKLSNHRTLLHPVSSVYSSPLNYLSFFFFFFHILLFIIIILFFFFSSSVDTCTRLYSSICHSGMSVCNVVRSSHHQQSM